ncbi:MAG: response regulator [Actinomycetota bacterium]
MTASMSTNKLSTILLIDDDDADNYIHQRTINKAGIADHVEVRINARSALEYLASDVSAPPSLIFLDINMPGMNGWEFLAEYERLPPERRGSIVLVMLSTSDNPEDVARAQSFDSVNGYRSKPLTGDMLVAIIEEFFPS